MIQIKDLKKSFRTEEVETLALNGVNLSVEEGEFVAIMGPSGCGKSTLLNIIGMLDNPSEGSYNFAGHEVAGLKESQRTQLRKGNLGFVFQSFNLIDELTVYENVELPLIYLKMGKAERREKVKTVLERMKIAHREKHFPQQLSGGQQQRVAISRAMNLLTELNQEGTTIIMVTHSDRDSHYAHRVINLFDGQIVTESQNRAVGAAI